ncbi:MAG: hypothetical protein CVU63_00685 [Deltaproteobacteria bacterium HGW-Deltaproteobacteria-20]|nr:MAG: hypothetical protein CVU63_00685 [Deltaproteobacteria bacterium HGW-Deltaproteobacteria-20]
MLPAPRAGNAGKPPLPAKLHVAPFHPSAGGSQMPSPQSNRCPGSCKKTMPSHPFAQLVALGKQQGFLTYDDVHASLPDSMMSADRVSDLMTELEREHIEVVPSQARRRSAADPRGRGRARQAHRGRRTSHGRCHAS